jgi:hypothetical protein
MRHPAMLGAARREWRDLTELAADLARALAAKAAAAGQDRRALTGLASYPRPSHTGTQRADRAALLDLTVARPGVRRAGAAADELHDRVTLLRHVAWAQAHGRGPVCVLQNLVEVAARLHGAAADAHRRASREHGSDSAHHSRAVLQAQRHAELWRAAAATVSDLRSPDRAAHPVQMERMRIGRLLDAGLRDPGLDPGGHADSLTALAASFDEVARFCREALLARHSRGDLLIRGGALTAGILAKDAELISHRLADTPAPLPVSMFPRIDAAFRALQDRPTPQIPHVAPPAA